MPNHSRNDSAPWLARVLLRGADLTDGQLLEGVIAHGDPAALEALVRRHGTMVWGVCRRVLCNHHDAEDAFQATFLVLVRRAASVRSPEALANWLYGVAHQTARKARSMAARRREREGRLPPDLAEPSTAEHDSDLRPLLDRELSRLPAPYRTAVVLCDLEGKTRSEAAAQLGLPEGTVASRLARGRGMLARRLARRGLAAGSLAALLSREAAACVPVTLAASTGWGTGRLADGQAAAGVAALTNGVLNAMLVSRFKIVAALLALVAGAVFAASGLTGGPPPAGQVAGGPKADAPLQVTPSELYWVYVNNEAAGDERFLGKRVRLTSDSWYVKGVERGPGQPRSYLLVLDVPDRREGDPPGTPHPSLSFAFRFAADARKELASLEPGRTVTVEGVCVGRTAEASELITLSDCRVVVLPKP